MESEASKSFLILLPPVPQPATYATVKAAFNTPLLLALRTINGSTSGRTVLDVALPCPHLYNTHATRGGLYAQTQDIVANVYKLVCVIAARQGIEVADVHGDAIDVRILLMPYRRDGLLGAEGDYQKLCGPVIDLQTLAQSGRAWSRIFSVETEQGEQLLKNFASFARTQGSPTTQKLRGGVVQVDKSYVTEPPDSGLMACDSVAVGGTFDHLHIGHKLLLTMTAFLLDAPSERGKHTATKVLTIGVTAADLLAKKQYAEHLQSWRTRTDGAHAFLRGILAFSPGAQDMEEAFEEIHKEGPNGHAVVIRMQSGRIVLEVRYVEIWDPFGPTITDPDIDTLVVSAETRSGGKLVNEKRTELKMKKLTVFEVDVLDTDEEGGVSGKAGSLETAFQAKLSSTEIRKAQADKSKGRSRV